MTTENLGQILQWTNQRLRLYHGTDVESAQSIQKLIDLTRGREEVDFGQGFYTTTSFRQALDWAEKKALRRKKKPAVVEFYIEREELSSLDALWFVRADVEAEDFWSFIAYCRGGGAFHGRPGWYDLVAGPVSDSSLFGRTTIPGYDQISFHSERAIRTLRMTS